MDNQKNEVIDEGKEVKKRTTRKSSTKKSTTTKKSSKKKKEESGSTEVKKEKTSKVMKKNPLDGILDNAIKTTVENMEEDIKTQMDNVEKEIEQKNIVVDNIEQPIEVPKVESTVVQDNTPKTSAIVVRKKHHGQKQQHFADPTKKEVEGEYINEKGNRVIPFGGKPAINPNDDKDGIDMPMEEFQKLIEGGNITDMVEEKEVVKRPPVMNTDVPFIPPTFIPPGDQKCYVYFKARLSSFTTNGEILDIALIDNNNRSFYGQITDVDWRYMDGEITKALKDSFPIVRENVLPKPKEVKEGENADPNTSVEWEENIDDWIIRAPKENVIGMLCMWLKEHYLDAGKPVQFVGDNGYFEFALLISALQGGESVVSKTKEISPTYYDLNQLISEHLIIDVPKGKTYAADIKNNYIPVMQAAVKPRHNIGNAPTRLYPIDLLQYVERMRAIHNFYMEFEHFDKF